MLEFHRVFTHWEDDLWVGVNWAARYVKLTSQHQYVTLNVAQQRDVCLTMPDGRTLCDYGPEHDHDRP